MASAVNEGLGLGIPPPAATDGSTELKSPEQHQASMFAARQQAQAKCGIPKPQGPKKVAAIKPQLKQLSKKSSFVPPFVKKEIPKIPSEKNSPLKKAENLSPPKKIENPSPPKKAVNKQLDKICEPASPGSERQLPTVSSRYHSPSLKRQRGRHPDELAPSDEEPNKSKFPKKSFTSPDRRPAKSSPVSSPSAKQPARSSPRTAHSSGIPNSPITHSPSLFQSQPENQCDALSDPTDPNQRQQVEELSNEDIQGVRKENGPLSEQQVSELSQNNKQGINQGITELVHPNGGYVSPEVCPKADNNGAAAADPDLQDKVTSCYNLCTQRSYKSTNSSQMSNKSSLCTQTEEGEPLIEETVAGTEEDSQKVDTVPETEDNSQKVDTVPETEDNSQKDIFDESDADGKQEKDEDELQKDSNSSHAEVHAGSGGPDGDSSTTESTQLVEISSVGEYPVMGLHKTTCEDSVGSPIVRSPASSGSSIAGVLKSALDTLNEESVPVGRSEEVALCTSGSEEEAMEEEGDGSMEILLTPQQEALPSHGTKKKRSSGANDQDRQKVTDYFNNKFGMSLSTPKGADRPKPLLKFAKKSDDQDSDYTGRSPGKFKSTFRALDSVLKKVAEENNECSDEEMRGTRKVEKKTKRKIERSPKRVVKKAPVKRVAPTVSSSEASDSDSCTNKRPAKKEAPKQNNNRSQQVRIKPEAKRKKALPVSQVYSDTSESESSENEFTLSCANSDNSDCLWVQCDKCSKWRYLRDTIDPNLIPDDWICSMNPDKRFANCDVPEENYNQCEQGYEFIYSSYSLGSLVWAKMAGYPWWPGMIDNDPVAKSFYYQHANSQLPDKYHVTFFGIQATRAWLHKKSIKVYNPDDKEDQTKYDQRKSGKGMREAIAMANQAFHLELKDRKKIYGFREQYKSIDESRLPAKPAPKVLEIPKGKHTINARNPIDAKPKPLKLKITSTENANKNPKSKSKKKKGKYYVSRLYEAAVARLSQESQLTHSFAQEGPGRGRGRPKKTASSSSSSSSSAKTNKRKKINKVARKSEESYIPSSSARMSSIDVIEGIENEINEVLRNCSPSPTNFME